MNGQFKARVRMTALVSIILATLLPGAPAWAQHGGSGQNEDARLGEVLDKIIAMVDDEAILLSDLFADVQSYVQQVGQMPDSAGFESLLNEALDNRVSEMLLVAKARREEMQIGEDELDRAMDGHIERLIEQAGGQSRFESELRHGGLSERELRQTLRPDMRRQLLVQRVLERFSYEVDATDEEARAFYDANKDDPEIIPRRPTLVVLSHLLVKPQAGEARMGTASEKLERIKARLAAGEEFAAVAVDLSEGPAAARGGDLGWFNLRDLAVPALQEALLGMAAGDIRDDVVSDQGLHVLKVEERSGTRVHFRQIFIPLPLGEEELQAARDRAREALSKLRAGEDWAAVVVEYSDDPTTSEEGGLLPEVPEAQLEDLYRGIMQALEPGEISSVFKGVRGYQIVRLESRDRERVYGYEEIAEQLRTQLANRKRGELLDQYLEDLRTEINIVYQSMPSMDEMGAAGGGR